MKILYYDVFCGISGDMNLGALIDLGVPEAHLIEELKKIELSGEYRLEIKRDMKMGITGTKVDVLLASDMKKQRKFKLTNPKMKAVKLSKDGQNHGHGGSHDHRTYKIIKDMIEGSTLSDTVKKMSVDMFYHVAKAEGKVHGKPLDEVHFHEVGAVDSIVDIIGAAICIDYLKVDQIWASSIQVGGGMVMCAHGMMPVPAPATAEILFDVPLKYGAVQSESTTPTGAAIIKSNVVHFTDQYDFKVEKVGYGLGTKNFDIPNVLRVYLGNTMTDSHLDLETDTQYMIETNIDDMNPEYYEHIEEKLFSAGALDVYKTAILMKKSRPGTKLSVLCKSEDRDSLMKIIFIETTAAGLREYPVNKHMLKRNFKTIKTQYGEVQVKELFLNGEVIKSKPESDDCRRLAIENNVPLKMIYQAVKQSEEN